MGKIMKLEFVGREDGIEIRRVKIVISSRAPVCCEWAQRSGKEWKSVKGSEQCVVSPTRAPTLAPTPAPAPAPVGPVTTTSHGTPTNPSAVVLGAAGFAWIF